MKSKGKTLFSLESRAVKTNGELEAKLHAYLHQALDAGDWSA
jgi:hypothetical protein